MTQSIWNKLEVLGHHVNAGQVWDGDQIDKKCRNQLIEDGYLRRETGGFTISTLAGDNMWNRWKHLYAIRLFLKKIQWRIRERRLA